MNPPIRTWSGNSGFALANWKIDWLNHRPIDALTAIHVGASSQTCALRVSSTYRRSPTCGALTAADSPAGSLTVQKMRNDTPYTTAFRKNAVGPNVAKAIGATANPAPRPSSVAPSKRADILPRRPSSMAVTIAMKPRIDGMLAAVEAPSSQRVTPRTTRLPVIGARRMAIGPVSPRSAVSPSSRPPWRRTPVRTT